MWEWFMRKMRWLFVSPPKYIVEFEPIELVSEDGLVMVELDNIGEGWDGDYDPDDLEDTPLLRYTLYRKYSSDLDQQKFIELCDTDAYEEDEWAQVRDGSYCTGLDARLPRHKIAEAAKYILEQVEDDLRDLRRQKRHYETLSWVTIGESGVTLMR